MPKGKQDSMPVRMLEAYLADPDGQDGTPAKILEAFFADDEQKLVSESVCDDYASFEFEEIVKDMPNEQQVRITSIVMYVGKDDYLGSYIHKRQKFLCVNGPLVGRRVPERHAPEYALFNRSSVVPRNANIPTAVLVHRSAFAK